MNVRVRGQLLGDASDESASEGDSILIKVLVVDDHDLVRTGIVRMLADVAGIQVVGQADSGENALMLARELEPDVVLMDVRITPPRDQLVVHHKVCKRQLRQIRIVQS